LEHTLAAGDGPVHLDDDADPVISPLSAEDVPAEALALKAELTEMHWTAVVTRQPGEYGVLCAGLERGMTANPGSDQGQTINKVDPRSPDRMSEQRKRGGRYWDRTSDLFGVKHLSEVAHVGRKRP
jgi:hypothetical protein